MEPESSFMSRETLDQYFSQYISELTLISQGLAKKWFRLFDGLAEDPANAGAILLNEAYIEAASHSCHFDPDRGSFCSWFLGIMYHILRKKQRSLAQKQWQQLTLSTLPLIHEELLECDQLDSLLFRASSNPEYHCIMREQVEWFFSFLNAQDRTIVSLYFFDGLQGPDIAQRLHWSLNHFHTHLQKIFRRLRIIAQERLKDWDGATRSCMAAATSARRIALPLLKGV